MGEQLTLRLPSAMRRRRLQSAQKALVMEVMKDTLPRKPGTRKFLATSPLGSYWQPQGAQLTKHSDSAAQRICGPCNVPVYIKGMDTLWVANQKLRSELQV